MQMDKKLFKICMKNNKDTVTLLSKELGCTRQAVYYKMKHGFSTNEIEFFKKRWKLTAIGADRIFLGGDKN